jgi:hypothetical protein
MNTPLLPIVGSPANDRKSSENYNPIQRTTLQLMKRETTFDCGRFVVHVGVPEETPHGVTTNEKAIWKNKKYCAWLVCRQF